MCAFVPVYVCVCVQSNDLAAPWQSPLNHSSAFVCECVCACVCVCVCVCVSVV